MSSRHVPVPFAFFGIAVGLLAMANAWHTAERLWNLPPMIGTGVMIAGLLVWVVLLVTQARRWFVERESIRTELKHPVQSLLFALMPISSMLAAGLLLPISHPLAQTVFIIALTAHIIIGLWLCGRFWQGAMPPQLVTPAMYLPSVAQNFVAGTTSAAFGWHSLGMMFFGIGLFSWLKIESVILHRAATHEPLPPALRPTLGIQLAPPVVGGVSYLSLVAGTPDFVAYLLLGYGIYMALTLLRLLPWIQEQPFVPGYWAFSFGVAALPTLAMRMAERGATDLVVVTAPILFIASNVVILILVVKTLIMWAQGRLLPLITPVENPPAASTPTQPAVATQSKNSA